MKPEYAGSGSDAKVGWSWNQMGNEEKKAMVTEEMKKMQLLPPNSSYASHRLQVLNKIHQLLSHQVGLSHNYADCIFCYIHNCVRITVYYFEIYSFTVTLMKVVFLL